jgi:hypothetical protein
MNRRWLPLWSAALVVVLVAPLAHATEVWTGRTYGFTKTPFANPALAQNQDRITPTCWITRANTMGIYNAALETGYIHNVSPANTEWATGDAVNHASLVFQDWEDWTGANPPATVGVNACMHIIDADIYLDIVFTQWGALTGGGGSFSYLRALPPVVPTTAQTWGRIKALYR